LIAVLALVLAAGCGPTRTLSGPMPPPLDPGQVIDAHNAWADSIQHLWSRAAITIALPDLDKPSDRQTFDVDGHLFLVKPDNMLLRGQILGQEVFQVGMNDDRFWVIVRPKSMGWTGRRGGPGERRFVLSPSDLMMALGLYSVNLESGDSAAFHVGASQYILVQHIDTPDHRELLRKTWFDRRTLRPVRVDLFDDLGRPLFMSELLAYETIESVPVCTTYRIRLYSGGAEGGVVLSLSATSLTKEVLPPVFKFRPPPDARIEDLDAAPR
jgi:hypothetical protein